MTTKGVKIKKASATDAQSIHKVNKVCLPLSYSTSEIISMINSKDHIVLIAKNNKKNIVIGFLLARYKKKNKCHILSFGVLEEYRKQGIGSQLITSVKDYIDNRANQISLNVHVENESAIKFYKKHEFEIIKTRKDYYCQIEGYILKDAYYMIKQL